MSSNKPSSLAEMLATIMAEDNRDGHLGAIEDGLEIVCPTVRIPRAVWDEISMLARANRMSASLWLNMLLDGHLRGQGRKSYAELAPDYAAYALRRKQNSR